MTMHPKNPPSQELYTQMLLWGWKAVTNARTGAKDLMTFAPADFSIEVNAPDNPDHNKVSVVKAIIRVTTGGDARRFWDRKVSVTHAWLMEEAARRDQEKVDRENDPTAPVKKPSSAAHHLQTEEAKRKAEENRGMTTRVLAWLEKQSEPVGQAEICAALDIEPHSVRNAIFQLRQNGRVITPFGRGKYQTPASYRRAERRARNAKNLVELADKLDKTSESLKASTAATRKSVEAIQPKPQKLPANRRGQRIVDMSAPTGVTLNPAMMEKGGRTFVHEPRQRGKTERQRDIEAAERNAERVREATRPKLTDLGDEVRTWPVMTMTADEARRRKIAMADEIIDKAAADDWATVEDEKQRLLDEPEREPTVEDRIEAALNALLPGGFDARVLFDPQRNEALQVFVGACKQVLDTYRQPSPISVLADLFRPTSTPPR